MTDPLSAGLTDLADLECVVVEATPREPGFYETRTRAFYVTRRGDVFLLRAPGAPFTVQPLDDLPEGAGPVPSSAALELHRRLAALIEHHAGSTPATSS